MNLLGQSITRNGLLLGLFALVTATVVAGTWQLTREDIAEQKRRAEERALLEVVPAALHDNRMLDDTLPLPSSTPGLGLRQDRQLWLARRDGTTTAVVIPVVARDGYSGDVELIVGVQADGRISGVRVLSHRETPGLGDKVDTGKSDWIHSFRGRALDNPPAEGWAVRKDGGVFDQFTGATITPRAVVAATRRALVFVNENRDRLFGKAADALPGSGESAASDAASQAALSSSSGVGP